jgi:acyl-homoserine lactone acylase PvdQ
MRALRTRISRRVAGFRQHLTRCRPAATWGVGGVAILAVMAVAAPAGGTGLVATAQADGGRYQATIVRTAYGVPHITASAQPSAAADLTALAASEVRAAPGTDGLPAASQLRKLDDQAVGGLSGTGSNAIAVGSAGTSNQHGMLLGNPHLPWQGALHLYQVQLTIPGTINVEGASVVGIPLVLVGFTSSMAWSETTSRSWTVVPYQLTLVPGHPTEYVYDGEPVAMTGQAVTVRHRGRRADVRRV